MAVTEEDLRLELDYEPDEWNAARATAIIDRSRKVVRSMVGGWRVDNAEANGDQDKLDAIDEATMVLAVARFENPASVLQQRAGQDNSVSYADSSEAAGGRKEARDILKGAFGSRQGVTTL